MKNIIILLAFLSSVSLSAQWQTGDYVDDFGDKTGKSYTYMVTQGTFSNTATINSKCIYQLVNSGTSLTINVLEYGSNPANFSSNLDHIIKIKTPSGEVKTVKVFINEKYLYVDDAVSNRYTTLMGILEAPGKYTVVFEEGDYSKSSYKFSFTIK